MPPGRKEGRKGERKRERERERKNERERGRERKKGKEKKVLKINMSPNKESLRNCHSQESLRTRDN